ncbi:hypothetical protein [Acinetobacter bereziniae]|uniref:hypothetical protein n=1 Tax=Acinetobacter bereziniae TaxID=106648 RepID=UPI00124FFF94|nr:hypothetical protein [Acinetobacter bereziniae]
MNQNFIQTLQDYVQDGVAVQSLGSAMLQCNGMLVPDNMPEIALLITNYSRPVITNNESADFNLAGGGQFHIPGAPKNRYEGQIQIIETDIGQGSAFAELIMACGGSVGATMFDGRSGRYTTAHEITNCTFTFEPLDIDSEGVSAIQRIQGSIKYNYYGRLANLGTGTALSGQIKGSNDGVQDVLNKAQKLLNAVYSGNTLIKAMRDIF